jgi:hypothetical protein
MEGVLCRFRTAYTHEHVLSSAGDVGEPTLATAKKFPASRNQDPPKFP